MRRRHPLGPYIRPISSATVVVGEVAAPYDHAPVLGGNLTKADRGENASFSGKGAGRVGQGTDA